jgi:hypothetical protein
MDRGIRHAFVLASVFVLLALAAGAAGYFSEGGTKPPGPSQAEAVASTQGLRGSVRSLNGDTLSLNTESGPRDLRLAPAAPIEALRPVTLAQIAVGDWINAGAVTNAQTIFALTGLTVIPQGQVALPSR